MKPAPVQRGELPGYHEAKKGPGQHHCGGQLYDATISRGRIVLVCYDCLFYWHTGFVEGDQGITSLRQLKAEADTLYQGSKDQKREVVKQRDREFTEKMYRDYHRGMSLGEVCRKYNTSYQIVLDRFKRCDLPLRPKKEFSTVEWNGRTYVQYKEGGFFRRYDETKSYLHRDVWEFHNGPLPEGCMIKHRDGDKSNNDICNLYCPSTKKQEQMRQKRLARIERITPLYLKGLGLHRISKKLHLPESVIYARLKQDGVTMRPRYKKLLPQIEFNGAMYTLSGKDGYYRKTKGDRDLLQHDVWEYYCGPIPCDHVIYHLDRDRRNNELSNLVCVSKSEMRKIDRPPDPDPDHPPCLSCGREMTRKLVHGREGNLVLEGPTAFLKRLTCNPQCSAGLKKGKPHGWRFEDAQIGGI